MDATLPDLSQPYKTSGKITHRAWFSPDEYKTLYDATRRRAREPLNNPHRWACEQLHDYVLFMADTGLRPDEAGRLQFRDVKIVKDAGSQADHSRNRSAREAGCRLVQEHDNAVLPFKRLRDRKRPEALPVRRWRQSHPSEVSERFGTRRHPSPGQRRSPSAPGEAWTNRSALSDDPPRTAQHAFSVSFSSNAIATATCVPHTACVTPTSASADGGGRHLPDRQELPHERRNDREISMPPTSRRTRTPKIALRKEWGFESLLDGHQSSITKRGRLPAVASAKADSKPPRASVGKQAW